MTSAITGSQCVGVDEREERNETKESTKSQLNFSIARILEIVPKMDAGDGVLEKQEPATFRQFAEGLMTTGSLRHHTPLFYSNPHMAPAQRVHVPTYNLNLDAQTNQTNQFGSQTKSKSSVSSSGGGASGSGSSFGLGGGRKSGWGGKGGNGGFINFHSHPPNPHHPHPQKPQKPISSRLNVPSQAGVNHSAASNQAEASLVGPSNKLKSADVSPLFYGNVIDLRIKKDNRMISDGRFYNNGKGKSCACHECGEVFNAHYKLAGHVRVHTGVRPFICNMCGQGFTQTSSLNRHKTSHTSEKPFVCKFCGKAFRLKGNCRTHELTHSGEKHFVCEFCGKAFLLKGNCRTHELTHSGEKRFVCEFCGRAFRQNSSLNSHMHTHRGTKPYPCKSCGKGFCRNYDLNKHTRNVHGGPNHQLPCQQIPQPGNHHRHNNFQAVAVAAAPALQQHHHPHQSQKSISSQLNVPTSSQTSTNASSLVDENVLDLRIKKDNRMNSDGRSYNNGKGKSCACPVCGKVFNAHSKLAGHVRVHTGVRPFICKVCGQGFTQTSSLNRHKIGHTSKKLYKCQTCGRAFRQNSSLNNHMHTHDDKKPYTCESCGKGFCTNFRLKMHTRTIHTGRTQSGPVSSSIF